MKNISESIKQRLLNLARSRKEDFNFILRQYVLQRLLHRIGVSEYADDFLLKGGLLFWVWQGNFHRPTQDMDLLCLGLIDLGELKEIFLKIVLITFDDGLIFDEASLVVTEIKEDDKYQGVRIRGCAELDSANITYQIDVGFGDAIVKVKSKIKIPVFLNDLPSPKMKVYPVESVISEKFHAMVSLGMANSRMKDFFDIVSFAAIMPLQSDTLQSAIKTTFEKRETAIFTGTLMIFTDQFKLNADKEKQWQAFIQKNKLATQDDFSAILDKIRCLLEPLCQQLNANITNRKNWNSLKWCWE